VWSRTRYKDPTGLVACGLLAGSDSPLQSHLQPKKGADIQDGLHLEVLDMRAHVWGVEQDLQKVVKTGQSLLPLELN